MPFSNFGVNIDTSAGKIIPNECRNLDNFLERPSNCRTSCRLNSECSLKEECRGGKCEDPCLHRGCGAGSLCYTDNHTSTCACQPGFYYDYELKSCKGQCVCIENCFQIFGEPPNCRSYCLYDTECPSRQFCIKGKCENPCDRLFYLDLPADSASINCTRQDQGDPFSSRQCGANSVCCEPNNVCRCLWKFFGRPPNCRSQCLISEECPLNQRCRNGTCEDPCLHHVCGVGAVCRVDNRNAVCKCQPGFDGDPSKACRQEMDGAKCVFTAGKPGVCVIREECVSSSKTLKLCNAGSQDQVPFVCCPQLDARRRIDYEIIWPLSPKEMLTSSSTTPSPPKNKSSHYLKTMVLDEDKKHKFCELPNGLFGTCEYLALCPSVQEAKRKGETFKICAVHENFMQVCCPKEDMIQNVTSKSLGNTGTYFMERECLGNDGSNAAHVCVPIEDCPSSNRSRLTICYTHSRLVFACCPKRDLITSTPAVHPRVPTAVNTSPYYAKSKSWEHCLQYSDLARGYPEFYEDKEFSCNEYESSNLGYYERRGYVPSTCYPVQSSGTVEMDFPHMAALGYGPPDEIEWSCAGSLISSIYVLTAAHCFTIGQVTFVHLGKLDLMNDHLRDQYEVEEVMEHPDFHPPSRYNDIGLVKLARKVLLLQRVRPACLGTRAELDFSDVAFATGWALNRGNHLGELQRDEVRYMTNDTCNRAQRDLIGSKILPRGIDNNSMICAAGSTEDPCHVDSGSPLQEKTRHLYCMHTIVGIASYGKESCAESNSPLVYTRVSHFIPWIESIVWPMPVVNSLGFHFDQP